MGTSDIIILTKKLEDGERLKRELRGLSNEFLNVPCFTSKELTMPNGCKYIFSTWYMPEFSVERIKSLFPSLQCIFYAAGTVKYFAEPFLKNGIRVFSASTANGIPVAEFTVAQIILANKGYFQSLMKYRNVVWPMKLYKSKSIAEIKHGNYGATIGIIGCGTIGSRVIELLKPYNFKVIVYDPFVPDDKLKLLGASRSDLKDLFSQSDVISNHLPDIPSTQGLINYQLLSRMKPTGTFINTGRGRQVIEKDLAKVLRKNKAMCALLDVTAHEPLFPWNALHFCKNAFITPHIAGSLSNEYKRMVEFMIEAYHSVISGVNCQYEIFMESLKSKT